MKKTRRSIYEGKNVKSIRDLLDTTVNNFPNKIAYRYRLNPKDKDTIDITYSEFRDDITNLGTALMNLNLEGKKIALISPNRYEWCVSYMAISIGNMTIIPLDKSLPSNELKGLIIRSNADCVIFDKKYIDTFLELKEENSSNLSYFICMDYEEDTTDILSYSKLMKEGKILHDNGDRRHDNAVVDTSKMSIMLFTSGTTSLAKAVMLTQDNLCSNVNAISQVIKLTYEDNMLSFLPLHHTFESTTTLLYGTSCGVTIGFCDGLKYIVKNLSDYKVSAMVSVPVMLDLMYKKQKKGIDDSGKSKLINSLINFSNKLLKIGIDIRRIVFKSVLETLGGNIRLIVCGGAAMDKVTGEGLSNFGIEILQGYGLTETSPVIAAENDKYRRSGSIGLPFPNLDVKIDNPDENGIGEIIVKGPNVMLGYYENSNATEEVLKDGWFYTGDLGYQDDDGYLYVTGRKKNVIVLKNGKNIFPEELEILINRLPFVTENIVYGKPDKDNDLTLCVKIVYNKDALLYQYGEKSTDEYHKLVWEEIKKINKTMPAYKYIRELIITDEPLIKTTTQKVKRHEEIKKILSNN